MWHKKKKDDDRASMNATLDTGSSLESCTLLKLEGNTLVTDSEIELETGTAVTLYPLGSTIPPEIFEVHGSVRGTIPDIMVSAFAQNRYLLSIDLDITPHQQEVLAREIASARPNGNPRSRPFTEPHREGLFQGDIADQIGPTLAGAETS